jgi:IS30 family transposase
VGKGHRGALITLVERKSKYLLMKQVDRYTAREVLDGIETMIRQDDLPFKSLAVDNGREFAYHEQLTDQFEMPIYCAHPHHSWERGLNENTNGLVRQYFTRGSSFKRITNAKIQRVQDKLNHRARYSWYIKAYMKYWWKENGSSCKLACVALIT